MLMGAHIILYSRDADADRTFLKDVLGFHHVDAGQGWLIFALPPTEIAVHPGDDNESRELYLLTTDLDSELRRLSDLGVPHDAVTQARWGMVTYLTLPGGGRVGLYQPRHPLAISAATD